MLPCCCMSVGGGLGLRGCLRVRKQKVTPAFAHFVGLEREENHPLAFLILVGLLADNRVRPAGVLGFGHFFSLSIPSLYFSDLVFPCAIAVHGHAFLVLQPKSLYHSNVYVCSVTGLHERSVS